MPSLLPPLLLSAVLLGGCASAPPVTPAVPVQALLRDSAFRPPSETIDPASAFALTPEIKRFVQEELLPRMRAGGGRQRVLVEALHSRTQMRLEYDSERTRNASEAFAARSGNCLSLVLLTAAVAKEVGLRVTYNRAVIDEAWSRAGDLYFLSGHVNVTLGRRFGEEAAYDGEHWLMVDFLPPKELAGLKTVQVSESTVVAMYLNNRAAEALARGEVHDAYWWARAALRHERTFLPAYNTLAVVYLREGDAVSAEKALRHLLHTDPKHRQALANLSLALKQQGRVEEAKVFSARLAALEDRPPFQYFTEGMAALREGRWRAARELFERELQRDPDYHELHYWAGIASLRLGDATQARRHFTLALKNSTTRGQQGIYAAKLDAMNQRQ